jgi:uncharacterized membrane protein (DUF2068 family)
MATDKRRGEASLLWIGAYKLLHGILLVIVATGLFTSVNVDLQTLLEHWVKVLHLDADNRHVAALLHEAGLIDERQLRHFSEFVFVYGAVFMTEGLGLIFKRGWAEYLTLIVTLSFIPLELYELLKRFTGFKLAILAINLAIAVFLIVMLKRKPERTHPQ